MTALPTDTPPPAHAPLAGIHVVELGANVAAPYGTEVLGDLGATVIKVEKPDGGDDARTWGPPFWQGSSAIFQYLNRNKRSITLDLKDEGQRELLRTYITDHADVVLQNFRPGTVQRMGLDAATLRARKPALIYCNLGAFGRTGPEKDKPGYDPLMQAFGGLMSVTGLPGSPPVRIGTSIIDMGTGMWCVIGILAALNRRHATGEGCEVDASLFETALGWMSSHVASYHASGKVPGKTGTGVAFIAPYQAFPTASGELIIAAPTDALFRRMAGALGHPEWADDPRYATNAERVAHRDGLITAMEQALAAHSKEHWQAALEAVGVPCAPLHDTAEVLAHPQTAALGIHQAVPDTDDMRQIGLPLSFDSRRPPIQRRPPTAGEHTDEILKPYRKDTP